MVKKKKIGFNVLKLCWIFIKWIIVSEFTFAFFSVFLVIGVVSTALVGDQIEDANKLNEWNELMDIWTLLLQIISIGGIIIVHYFILTIGYKEIKQNFRVSYRKTK